MESAINDDARKSSDLHPLRDMFVSPSTSENHEAINGTFKKTG